MGYVVMMRNVASTHYFLPQSTPMSGHGPAGRLILLRHGQSRWNVTCHIQKTTARFTGWFDIDLTERGNEQAVAAGRALRAASADGLFPPIDVAFTSLLVRARDTLTLALNEMDLVDTATDGRIVPGNRLSMALAPSRYRLPVISSWRLNERHYGALVGMSKEGAERLYGKEKLSLWRDSWDVPPPPMCASMVARWSQEAHCDSVTYVNDPGSAYMDKRNDSGSLIGSTRSGLDGPYRYGQKEKTARKAREYVLREKNVNGEIYDSDAPSTSSLMPASESLRDTYERVLPLWMQGIAPRLRAGETVLVSAHANTLRSMIHLLDPDICTRNNMKTIKVPSATPLLYEFRSASVGRNLVPGNLSIVPPPPLRENVILEPRHRLHGQWIETEEMKDLSFCTEVGQRHLEHEIA